MFTVYIPGRWPHDPMAQGKRTWCYPWTPSRFHTVAIGPDPDGGIPSPLKAGRKGAKKTGWVQGKMTDEWHVHGLFLVMFNNLLYMSAMLPSWQLWWSFHLSQAFGQQLSQLAKTIIWQSNRYFMVTSSVKNIFIPFTMCRFRPSKYGCSEASRPFASPTFSLSGNLAVECDPHGTGQLFRCDVENIEGKITVRTLNIIDFNVSMHFPASNVGL